jgi:ribose transport system permease protein
LSSATRAFRPQALSTTSLRALSRAKFLWILALAVIVVASIALPAFRSTVSVNSLLASLAPIVLIAVGQGIVVMWGGIDLSVGAIAGLATVVLSLSPVLPGGAALAVPLVLVAGLVVGLANGAGVIAGINPLLMTFAASGVVQGFALLLQSTPGAGIPLPLLTVLGTSLGAVPLFALIALVVLVAAWAWMGQSRAGRYVQAVGYDQRIATRLGFPVRRSALLVYGLSGVFASLGGMAIASRTYTADALVGASSVIDSIATVLVAGIVITGGIGSLLSILPAAVIIAVVGQVITLTGTDTYYQTIFKGVLLIAAMGVYGLADRGLKIPWRLRPKDKDAAPAQTRSEPAR